MVLSFFEVSSLPDKDFDRVSFIGLLGGASLAIIYDFSRGSTILGIDEAHVKNVEFAMKVVPGLEFSKLQDYGVGSRRLEIFSVYRKSDTVAPSGMLSDVFNLERKEGFLCMLLIPISGKQLDDAKKFIEHSLGKMGLRETTAFVSTGISGRASSSQQRDIVSDSEERLLLEDALDSVNNAILSGASSYKIFSVLEDEEPEEMEEYIRTRFLVLERFKKAERLERLDELDLRSLPLGTRHAASVVNFYNVKELKYVVRTVNPESKGDIALGTFMAEGAYDTGRVVYIDRTLLNLGFMITGLPGSGKTREAMHVVGATSKLGTKRIMVISPTDEWNRFAEENGMHLVRIYKDSTPINFFRCMEGVDAPVFYEDLAMLLSSASDAGPYRNPMEKCMLNAFKKVYEKEKNPDPILTYGEIEESIIGLHAKRTNTGVKYTKHGENIKSALENLRSILRRPEYSGREGIKFEELINEGVVFDLSNVSNKFKPYLYALLLNQAYMLANAFDTEGDSELRLLICLEEAQTILGQKINNAAAEDLKYRIQDFRKKGVGLLLLTHNVDDVDKGIRRLCQLKLYLKQAPDTAEVAAEDLVFTFAESDEIAKKLKHLDSRIGALSYIVNSDGEKKARDTVFIRTLDQSLAMAGPVSPVQSKTGSGEAGRTSQYVTGSSRYINVKIHFHLARMQADPKETVEQQAFTVRVSFMYETVSEHSKKSRGDFSIEDRMIEGRPYKIEVLNEKKKIIHSETVIAQEKIDIEL